jgi:hypothetical protein
MSKGLLVLLSLALASCNAPDARSPSMQSYQELKGIKADAREICIDMDAGATEWDFQACQRRVTHAIIMQRTSAADMPRTSGPAPAYTPQVVGSNSKVEFLELPKSCVVLPLGAAVTMTCNN